MIEIDVPRRGMLASPLHVLAGGVACAAMTRVGALLVLAGLMLPAFRAALGRRYDPGAALRWPETEVAYEEPRSGTLLAVLAMLGAALLCGIGAVGEQRWAGLALMAGAAWQGSRRVRVTRDGVSVGSGVRLEERFHPWSTIAAVREERVASGGVRVWLWNTAGERFRVDVDAARADDVLGRVRRAVMPRLLGEYRWLLDAGQPLPFGPLSLTADGLTLRVGGAVPWSAIERVVLDAESIHIFTSIDSPVRLDLSRSRNLPLLHPLLAAALAQRGSGAAVQLPAGRAERRALRAALAAGEAWWEPTARRLGVPGIVAAGLAVLAVSLAYACLTLSPDGAAARTLVTWRWTAAVATAVATAWALVAPALRPDGRDGALGRAACGMLMVWLALAMPQPERFSGWSGGVIDPRPDIFIGLEQLKRGAAEGTFAGRWCAGMDGLAVLTFVLAQAGVAMDRRPGASLTALALLGTVAAAAWVS